MVIQIALNERREVRELMLSAGLILKDWRGCKIHQAAGLSPRMSLFICGAKSLWGDVGINLGGLQRGVAQDFLNAS